MKEGNAKRFERIYIYKERGLIMYIERLGTSGERCIAYFIDHILITIIFIVGAISLLRFENIGIVLTLVPLLYLIKDAIKGKSIGKRLFKLAVRDRENIESDITVGKSILRNLLLVIWPIEFMALLLSTKGQRIGDMLCNTVVVKLTSDEPEEYEMLIDNFSGEPDKKRKSKIAKILLLVVGLFIAFVLSLIIMVSAMMKNSGAYDLTISEIETSEEVENRIGEITGFGFMPTGNISISNGYGEATLVVKVKGDKDNVKVATYCTKEPGKDWVINDMEIVQ